MSIEDSKEKTLQQGLFVGHGHSNSFDRMIALEPFRRSASGRNKLLTYLKLRRMLTAVNIDRDFTQSLMLILIDTIEAAKTLFLNIFI